MKTNNPFGYRLKRIAFSLKSWNALQFERLFTATEHFSVALTHSIFSACQFTEINREQLKFWKFSMIYVILRTQSRVKTKTNVFVKNTMILILYRQTSDATYAAYEHDPPKCCFSEPHGTSNCRFSLCIVIFICSMVIKDQTLQNRLFYVWICTLKTKHHSKKAV